MDELAPTFAELGALLGISRQAVAKCVARGMPTASADEARRWRKAHLDPRHTADRLRYRHRTAQGTAAASTADPVTPSWRDRLDKARAQLHELELDRQRGVLLAAAEVAYARERQLGVFRSRSLSIPSRCAALVPAAQRAAVFEIVQREIYAALTELAGGESEDTAPAGKGNGHA